MAIQDTANLTGWRMYGGHVYVAAGTVSFLNCHFWDSMILMPFTDVVAFGADVLVSFVRLDCSRVDPGRGGAMAGTVCVHDAFVVCVLSCSHPTYQHLSCSHPT